MIRVLHVGSRLGCGGTAIQLYRLYSGIDKNKIKFDFIVHGQDPGMTEFALKEQGSAVYHVTPKKASVLKNIREIDAIIKEGNYDAVHVHQNFSSFTALFSAWRHRVPVRIVHARGFVKNVSWKTRIKNALPGALNKLFANEIWAITPDAGKWLYGKAWDKKGKLFYDLIDTEKFEYSPKDRGEYREKLGLNGKFVLLMVGRFSPEKNHEFALGVFKELVHMQKNAFFLLVGEGKEEERIKKLASEMGLCEKVSFMGTTDQVEKIMNAADALIFPSLHEGFGDVAIEAQCTGLPVIASDRIPMDTKSTPVIHYLSLDATQKEWAERILTAGAEQRKGYASCMDRFSLKKQAQEYENYMIKLLSGSNKQC